MTWRWKSSTGPAWGTVSRTARVSTVRWNLKEAEGKALARRTEIAYKAVAVGKKANIFKAQYLHGNCGRRCGGYNKSSYPVLLYHIFSKRKWKEYCESRCKSYTS